MVLAGLGFIGYFAWQYWGTNYVAKQKQAEIKQLIVDDWDKGIDGNAIGLLRVPRFGDDYEVPIVKGGDLLGAKGDRALAEGVAWYEPGAKPGEIGNFAVAGHRVTHGEPFRDFLKLREGDKVFVETRRKVYTYVLRNDGNAITVDFTTSWPLADVPDPNRRGRRSHRAGPDDAHLLRAVPHRQPQHRHRRPGVHRGQGQRHRHRSRSDACTTTSANSSSSPCTTTC